MGRLSIPKRIRIVSTLIKVFLILLKKSFWKGILMMRRREESRFNLLISGGLLLEVQ